MDVMIFWRFVLYFCVLYTNIGLGFVNGDKCDKGQYKSDFLSGGCAQCPRTLKQCHDQEIDDIRRCLIACSGLFSTASPTTGPPSTITKEPESSTSQPSTVDTTDSTRKSEANSTTGRSTFLQSNSSNMTDIIFGMMASILALLLVLGACIVLWWRRRRCKRSRRRKTSTNIFDNRDQDLNDDSSTQTQEAREDVQQNSWDLSSVSQENLEDMQETHV